MIETPGVYYPDGKIPETDLEAIAEVSESDINLAIASWKENPPEGEFKTILEAKENE